MAWTVTTDNSTAYTESEVAGWFTAGWFSGYGWFGQSWSVSADNNSTWTVT